MTGPGSDDLTGLPDREAFLGLLRRRLAAPDRGELAVTVFDVAGFRDVNDRRGRAAGDRVLREVAVRLEGAVRGIDVVARVGGDEFAVLWLGLDAAEVDRAARTAASAVAPPIALQGVAIEVALTVGTATVPAGEVAPTAEILLAEAESRA